MQTQTISPLPIFLRGLIVLMMSSSLVLSNVEAKNRVGLVIETVEPAGVGDKAGVKSGDLFLTWTRLPNPPANPKAANFLKICDNENMDSKEIKQQYEYLAGFLNEKQRRLLAGADARLIGHGGVKLVAESVGLSRNTVTRGRNELVTDQPTASELGRVRKPGGGRKSEVENDPGLLAALEALLEPITRGDPKSPLRWTCRSVRKLSAEMNNLGHKTSHRMIAELLKAMNYSLQANRKTAEGGKHPDRNAQFENIYEQVKTFQSSNQPVISVDAKKKELVGHFKNNGSEWSPQGCPEEVSVYDFESLSEGKARPYGVYDLTQNEGWVSIGVDHDTAEFAATTIRRWWQMMGQPLYPNAERLLITADGGGSNGVRVRLWKTELQKLSNDTGMAISVCHFPPGTSKWNKIEHRLFSFISQNWRGKPLISYEVIVKLIAATATKTGLRVLSAVDTSSYEKGKKIRDEELGKVNLERNEFHGEWNYTIYPNTS